MKPEKVFTGSDVHAAIKAWKKLPATQQETWGSAARLQGARGETTTALAEFVAAELSVVVRRRERETRDARRSA